MKFIFPKNHSQNKQSHGSIVVSILTSEPKGPGFETPFCQNILFQISLEYYWNIKLVKIDDPLATVFGGWVVLSAEMSAFDQAVPEFETTLWQVGKITSHDEVMF